MTPLQGLARAWRYLRDMPLPLRMALIVSPLLLMVQLLTIRLLVFSGVAPGEQRLQRERAAEVAAVIAELDQSPHHVIAPPYLMSPGFRVAVGAGVDDGLQALRDSARLELFAEQLRERLPARFEPQVWHRSPVALRILRSRGIPLQQETLRLPPPDPVPMIAVTARLGDGNTVRVDLPEPGGRIDNPAVPLRGLGWVFLVTVPIVWLAAWWITRPLSRLARAAESLGRDVNQAGLEEDGPPEVRQAAVAFNRMQDRLLRFLRGRSDALLAMSHDLKTPITRLQLRVELLPEPTRSSFAADVALLQKRVEEALTFMRGVHPGEAMQDVDVGALAATVVERLQDTGAEVQLQGQARPLSCRPGQLERALANVVENAVRYGGGATVELVDGADALLIRVRDRGPGIPDELLARVTEPFFRIETSRSRDSGGTGLGLAISKDLVESMGGQLLLRNHPEGGLEATLSLPRQPR